jgi:Tfp pilus assembly protein PilX
MKKFAIPLNNQDGYFLILATLMILVLLTIMGVAASRTAITEVTTASNEMVYQRNFYLAEGALMEAVDILSNSADLTEDSPDWMLTVPGELTEDNVQDYWESTAEISGVDDSGSTRFVASIEDISGSLDIDKSTVAAIGVYGRCERNGVTMIKAGFLKVY